MAIKPAWESERLLNISQFTIIFAGIFAKSQSKAGVPERLTGRPGEPMAAKPQGFESPPRRLISLHALKKLKIPTEPNAF